MTEVFNGEIDENPEEGWYTISLTGIFNYNNTDNLVVAIDENNPGRSTGTWPARIYSTGANRALVRRMVGASNNIDPLDPGSGDLQSQNNQIQLTFDIVLPVNLSSFYALYTGGTPTLYWTTQSEEENAYWNVYRSTTDNFENALQNNTSPIPGNGTTSMPTDYVYVDETPVIQNVTYWYWIEDVSTDGETELHDPITLTIPFEDTPITPESYGLLQNYPNPFNPSTSISFALEQDDDVELVIYNSKGENVKTIFSDRVYADQVNTVIWNGDDESGKQISSGVYFYKLKTSSEEYSRKMILVK